MLRIHFAIGIGEAIITLGVLAVVKSSIVRRAPHGEIVGLAVALLVAILLSPWASASPDGLEYAAGLLGFADRATILFSAPLSDYLIAGISSDALSTAVAGAAGTLVVFGFVLTIASGRMAVMSRKVGD